MKLFPRKAGPTSKINPQNISGSTQEQFLLMLYEKYEGYLRHLAFSILHDEHDAEDVVGEVFLHLVKNISRLQQYSCYQLNNYVVICTRGRCLNQLGKRKVIQEHEQSVNDQQLELLELEATDLAVDAQVLRRIDLETASQLLDQITPAYRDAFKLKYQMGLDDAAIAQAIDIQPQSVKVYVRRAQNKLRELAIERGVVHEK